MKLPICALFALVAVATAVIAAEPAKAPKPEDITYLTAEEAGPDARVQGEYDGQFTAGSSGRVAIQVIARGNGKFHAVLYHGGLPGAGWDRSAKLENNGVTADGKIAFSGNGFTATISDGKIVGNTGKEGSFEATRVVRQSPTLGARPPAGAVVLFDGSDTDAWNHAHMDSRHLIQAGTTSKQSFGDFTLHAEFFLPLKPFAGGQARANSGVYLQDRYEIQVLDSFGLKGENNECGGIYSQVAPLVNMCLPPLQWQTYDIDFTAARFDSAGQKIKKAVTTIRHNGVLILDNQEIQKPTGGGKPETDKPGPIQLQGHGNPVFFQNIWIVEKKQG